jgi:NAD(P)-dependent dehydrogenase (short-subunit alcohol dehydrogenase family)
VAHLASWGAHVIVPCRRCQDGLQEQILTDAQSYRALYDGGKVPLRSVNVDVYQGFDLADMDSIDAFVQYCKKKGVRIPILIANAGLVEPNPTRTKQNFEAVFGVNFFGNAYLTSRLLAEGVLLPDARVVSVSSEDHRVGASVEEQMARTGKPFGYFWGHGITDVMDRYMYSKLAQTTWFLALGRKTNLSVIDMCPGPVGSEISSNSPWPLGTIVTYLLGVLFPSIQRASMPLVRFAISPEYAKVKADHFHLGEKRPARADARDVQVQDKVWDWTLQMFDKRSAPT